MPDVRPLCFIVGPIGEAGSAERKLADLLKGLVIEPVAEAAGYVVKRADNDAKPGSISSAVINDVFEADLVIADLTGFNPNAFYELGIRHGTGKATIHIIAESVRLPFDNLDQRTIFVDTGDIASIKGAGEQLRQAIESVQDKDYKPSNPVTQARGAAELAASGDTRDQVIAGLQSRISRLENQATLPFNPSIKFLDPATLSPVLQMVPAMMPKDVFEAQTSEVKAGYSAMLADHQKRQNDAYLAKVQDQMREQYGEDHRE